MSADADFAAYCSVQDLRANSLAGGPMLREEAEQTAGTNVDRTLIVGQYGRGCTVLHGRTGGKKKSLPVTQVPARILPV